MQRCSIIGKRKCRMDQQTSGAQKTGSSSIWSRDFVNIFMANLFLQLGLNMSYGILPPWAAELGGTAADIGFVGSMFAVSALAFKFISAPAIDAYNRKTIMSCAIVFFAITFVGYGLSPNCAVLSVANFMRGIGMAFGTTVALVIATDFLPEDKLGEGVGVFSLSQVVCSAAGPAIALNIAAVLGYPIAYYINAATELVALVFVLRIQTETRGTKPFKISLESVIAKEAITVTILAFLLACAYAALQTFVVVFGMEKGIPQEAVGLFFTVYAVALMFIRPFFGKLADRIGFRKVIAPGGVAFALAFIVLANADNVVLLLLSALLSAFGYGMCQPLLQALAMKLVPSDRRGAASCTYYLGVDGAFFVGPNITGWLVMAMGYEAMWYTLLVPVGIAVVVAMLLPMGDKQE